jgi:hypothetical protein
MQKRAVVHFYRLIAFTSRFSKSGNVEQFDVSPRVANEAGFLQSARDHGDTRAPDTQHLRDVLLSERQLVPTVQVGRTQQPLCQPALDHMRGVARCGLLRLREQGLLVGRRLTRGYRDVLAQSILAVRADSAENFRRFALWHD